MGIILNNGQKHIISEAKKWYKHSSEQIFQYAGFPGTGKSVVLNEIINSLGIPRERIAPMAYIGQAAIVMRLKGFHNAKTIHSWLFTPSEKYKLDENNNIVMNTYFNRPEFELLYDPKPIEDIDLFLIDEAGSVPYSLKEKIESRGKKIIATGDLGQLPPVTGPPAYLTEGRVLKLVDIMRQNENSAILYLADRARRGLPINTGYYGDCLVIYEDELTNEMIRNSDIVLCGKNKTREYINKRVRQEILNINYDLPITGENLICRKNNWNTEIDGISLANGLIGKVTNSPSVDGFDGENFIINFKPNMLNSQFNNIKCDYQYFMAPYDKKNFFKNNKYNMGEKFEFAYAITTHLSQGAQFNKGIYLEEYLRKDIQNNLNHTGITRFTTSVIYVKKRKKFY